MRGHCKPCLWCLVMLTSSCCSFKQSLRTFHVCTRSLNLNINLSGCLSIYIFISLYICILYIYIYICMSFHLSICLCFFSQSPLVSSYFFLPFCLYLERQTEHNRCRKRKKTKRKRTRERACVEWSYRQAGSRLITSIAPSSGVFVS